MFLKKAENKVILIYNGFMRKHTIVDIKKFQKVMYSLRQKNKIKENSM